MKRTHYGGDFGYIDTSGATVIEPRFRTAEPFRHGLALVSSARSDRRQYIDRKGKVIWDGRSVPIANDEILMPEEHEDLPEWPAPVPDDDRPASS